ncbi:AAA family ATPase [Listeria ivanovii]|uniref:Putative modulates DNA topology, (FlaR protein) n=1 Tax=Listeria ivanovii (strain ATCC BAA-678 / PAM 55) TaxID=881621 RepID=G2ZD09_LISIP|nr:DNA topology modulation protein FlaR [Listeria ivanovii]AHI55263.1 ATPase AAA [Listeria ivanovii WSLC3009]AIS64717.1 ATPase AAA [Listeria ivanovii subsp. ivanovii]MBC1758586.1 AAA family ATPase [Listeria ivanovii]MBK3913460.1 AAA family ATPase [Listeria ivanovii subsp. ivanovii]MBK3920422.1 AAA family ATPase [Listeria ivanovii subsp. ivanovii]
MNQFNDLQSKLKNKQRILVIGPNGAGKSTFSSKLGKYLSMEVYHLDKIFWKKDWEHLSELEFKLKIAEILNSEQPYIIDGDYLSSLKDRLAYADLVIWIKIPVSICLINIMKRRFKYLFAKRPDMAEGCDEKLKLSFLMYAAKYNKRSGIPTKELLENDYKGETYIIESYRVYKEYCKALGIVAG